MPKVTIALSVYNVEPYLRKSLDCIINQTYRDVEILCIDDCSKDGTYAILEEYAAKDDRIRLLKQPTNMGLSYSRNLAMAEAKGEYILMLDGDDLFDPMMVEKAVTKAEDTGADMVMWDYLVFKDESKIPELSVVRSEMIDIDKSDALNIIKRPGFIWTRLLRLQVVKDLGIHFPEGLTKQDVIVHWVLCTKISVEKIEIIPERLAYYRVQPTQTSSRKDRSLFSLAKVQDLVYDYLLQNPSLYKLYGDWFWFCRLYMLEGMYESIIPSLKDEAMQMINDRMDDDAWEFLHSERIKLPTHRADFYKMLEGKCIPTLRFKLNVLISNLYHTLKKY